MTKRVQTGNKIWISLLLLKVTLAYICQDFEIYYTPFGKAFLWLELVVFLTIIGAVLFYLAMTVAFYDFYSFLSWKNVLAINKPLIMEIVIAVSLYGAHLLASLLRWSFNMKWICTIPPTLPLLFIVYMFFYNSYLSESARMSNSKSISLGVIAPTLSAASFFIYGQTLFGACYDVHVCIGSFIINTITALICTFLGMVLIVLNFSPPHSLKRVSIIVMASSVILIGCCILNLSNRGLYSYLIVYLMAGILIAAIGLVLIPAHKTYSIKIRFLPKNPTKDLYLN